MPAEVLAAARSALVAALNDVRPSPDWAWDILNRWDELVARLEAAEAQVAALTQERKAAAVENASLRAALEGHEPSIWAERMVGMLADTEVAEAAGAAPAEAKEQSAYPIGLRGRVAMKPNLIGLRPAASSRSDLAADVRASIGSWFRDNEQERASIVALDELVKRLEAAEAELRELKGVKDP